MPGLGAWLMRDVVVELLLAVVTGASPYAAPAPARLLGMDHVVSSVFELD